MFEKFWSWYKRNYKTNLYIASGLFVWQLVHLYWLTVDVVFLRLFEVELWDVGRMGNILISIVDYTEIPAIIFATIFYAGELHKEFKWKSIIFLVFINSQWLHLFWITDEVVVAQWTGAAAILLPTWLSWLAIMIDYLELPVIYDTMNKTINSLRNKG